MSTPAKPRVSGIPGRSGIATPARSRASSSATATASNDIDFATRAFADALKSNDPAQHRSTSLSDASNFALSPQTSNFGLTDRRTFSSRPSSVASSRPKTPVARPTSRQADHPSRSSSRASKIFSLGDDVRIESLGFEGRLRFIGEIDGKTGTWAGVELGGGFFGMGKNDGSVNGKHYFVCPPKCGVFVATSKVSPATAGLILRPSSAASSYDGRSSPPLAGRVTPSHTNHSFNGRTTPSSGRNTPSYLARSSFGPRKSVPAPRTIGLATPKSTANISAKQLPSRQDSGSLMPPSSPTTSLRKGASSPKRSIPSPFSTPTPARTNHGTPRARVPSAVAMPPPSSPLLSQNESLAQERPIDLEPHLFQPSPLPIGLEDDHITQLTARLHALEYENDRLRSTPALQDETLRQELDTARQELDRMKNQKASLQSEMSSNLASIQQLETNYHVLHEEQETLQREHADVLKDLQKKVDDSTSHINALTEGMAALEGQGNENNTVLASKAAENLSLERRLRELEDEIADERKEKLDLVTLVDELRQAGQETIALYEDKLSVIDRDRYELETRLHLVESVGQRHLSTSSSNSLASPEQIDNETLRDQVQHLQTTISSMEDVIHDLRVNSEREDVVVQEKMKRLKDKEETMKKEVHDGRQQVQRLSKSESNARTRVEEIEGALQESKIALEIARAEVEALRAQLADLGGAENDDVSISDPNISKRESIHKRRLHDEIAQLQNQLSEARKNEQALIERLHQDDQVEMNILQDLRDVVDSLEAENTRLQGSNHEMQIQMDSLRTSMDERSNEIETLRKKNYRDMTINNGLQDPKSSSSSTKQEELTGLKHIVQELQQENRRLDFEKRTLTVEMEQQRQELRKLQTSEPTAGAASEQAEISLLGKKLTDLENKSTITIRDLNKEISELEALVESKIYREDELEQEVERLREKSSRQRKSSKSSLGSSDARTRLSASSSTNETICELCEHPGHDMLTCDLLKDDGSYLRSRLSTTPPEMTSYASVTMRGGLPLSLQPQSDPGMLQTKSSSSQGVADDIAKINVVPSDFKKHPRTATSILRINTQDGTLPSPSPSPASAPQHSPKSPALCGILDSFLFRPGIVGGIVGIVNVGLFASAAHVLYTQPSLRQDTKLMAKGFFGSVVVLFAEGTFAGWYSKTTLGQREMPERKEYSSTDRLKRFFDLVYLWG